MMSDYGVSKLKVRRVVELVKQYKDTIQQIYVFRANPIPLPYPDDFTDEKIQEKLDEAKMYLAYKEV
jgi:hypothetical protein